MGRHVDEAEACNGKADNEPVVLAKREHLGAEAAAIRPQSPRRKGGLYGDKGALNEQHAAPKEDIQELEMS
jgi:hypothetical protein